MTGARAQIGLDFAPLFESGDSLRSAGKIMRELLANPGYRAHLAARDVPQPRAGGLFAGQSGQRLHGHAAGRVRRAARPDAVAGGGRRSLRSSITPAAAAWRAAAFALDALIRAAPPETVNGMLRVTEQGETISQSYGLRSNALRTLERAFGALAHRDPGAAPRHGQAETAAAA